MFAHCCFALVDRPRDGVENKDDNKKNKRGQRERRGDATRFTYTDCRARTGGELAVGRNGWRASHGRRTVWKDLCDVKTFSLEFQPNGPQTRLDSHFFFQIGVAPP